MVSFMNNDSLKLYINNEAYPHFSNPFPYSTNLSFIDYPWNLLSPQTYYTAQKKKRKKLREQIASEKSIKELTKTIEPTKSEILEWYILNKKVVYFLKIG